MREKKHTHTSVCCPSLRIADGWDSAGEELQHRVCEKQACLGEDEEEDRRQKERRREGEKE
jgi:hypothetical protein